MVHPRHLLPRHLLPGHLLPRHLLPGHLLSRHLLSRHLLPSDICSPDICSPDICSPATLASQRHLLSRHLLPSDICSQRTFALQCQLLIDKIIIIYMKGIESLCSFLFRTFSFKRGSARGSPYSYRSALPKFFFLDFIA